jgi:hypothetical protein
MALRKIAVTILGWALVLLGLAAIILPGPGLLLLLLGLIVLSQEYEWASRRVEPVKLRAFDVARQGVSSYPRILLSTLGACCLLAAGIGWGVNPSIPTIGPVGPNLPAGGWVTGASLIGSSVIAFGLLAYSIRRFRP